jgi:hypothetical protein
VQKQKEVQPLGTEDLEAGLRPSHAREFAVIAAIAVSIMLVFNSGGLVRWTQRLPSSETSLWIATRAFEWNELMERAGTAQLMESLRAFCRRYTPEA